MKPIKLQCEKRGQMNYNIAGTDTPWKLETLKDPKNYIIVKIFEAKDFDKYEEAQQYTVDWAEEMSKLPIIKQATAYDNNTGSSEMSKMIHSNLEAYNESNKRATKKDYIDWIVMLRFTARDYDAAKKLIDAAMADCDKKISIPNSVSLVNTIYYIENHFHAKHDNFDLTAAQAIATEGETGSNKFGDFGFSMPSKDAFDPKMRTGYIDWYQEVRQHDVMRSNSLYVQGHMWLKLSSDQPVDEYVLTMYEYATDDFYSKFLVNNSQYVSLGHHRSDGGLYGPKYEGMGLVIGEFYNTPY